MRVRWHVVAPLALLLAGALFVAQALLFRFVPGLGRPPEPAHPIVGQAAPRIDLPGLDARGGVGPAQLASGGPVLVNLWASWCPPCRVEMPLLVELERTLQAGGATVLGVNVRDTPAAALAFLRAHGDPFARVGVDRGGQMLRAFRATGLPETYVVDAHGVVRWRHGGMLTERELPALLDAWRAAGGAPLPATGVPATAAPHKAP